ncbi:hypothetical protein Hanom_Chr04g00307801 [Helianthus anomalus]
MRDEVLPIIPLSCLRAGGGRVSAHLGGPRGWWQSSSRRCPQRPVSRWMTRRYLPLKKIIIKYSVIKWCLISNSISVRYMWDSYPSAIGYICNSVSI